MFEKERRLAIVGLDFERAHIVFDGLLQFALDHTEARIKQVPLEIIGVQLKRALKCGLGLILSPARVQRLALGRIGFGQVGIEFQRLGRDRQYLVQGRSEFYARF